MTALPLRRFWSLDPRERASQMHALGAVICARAALALLSFPRASRLLDQTPAQPLHGAAADAVRARIALEVQRASVRVPGASCLVQALAARALLTRAGVGADMHIGVLRSDKGAIEAHAWVESGGRILVGAHDAAFTPLSP